MATRRAAPNALTVTTKHNRQQVAIPHEVLISRAKEYATHEKAAKTQQLYAAMMRTFARWCQEYKQDPRQVGGEAMAAFVTWLADGGTGTRYAISSITAALSAVYAKLPAEQVQAIKANKIFRAVWKGIRRDIAGRRAVKQASPLLFKDARELLDDVDDSNPHEVRDACVLAIGLSGALRRSEIVGLDYGELGVEPDENRRGYVVIDDRGIKITLMRSKASQETAVDVTVPRDFAPLMVRWVETWVRVGKIDKGTPLVRGVDMASAATIDHPRSGYVGVTWDARTEKWRAQARLGGTPKTLGLFVEPYDAHVALCKAKGEEPRGRFEGAVTPRRLSDRSVSTVVKRAATRLLLTRAKKRGIKKPTTEDIKSAVAQFSGHSLRAGYVTSAALNETPVERMQAHTRHKHYDTMRKYIRIADAHTKSGLKGVGF